MSGSEILSQDEIDALLHGVDSGDVDTEPPPAPDEVRHYDLATQDRIVRGRLPTLEMINERFARHFRISLFNMLRRSPELSVLGIETTKFSEYLHTLYVPTNLNLIRLKPLRGTGLIVFEPTLVFAVVEDFFGRVYSMNSPPTLAESVVIQGLHPEIRTVYVNWETGAISEQSDDSVSEFHYISDVEAIKQGAYGLSRLVVDPILATSFE